MLHRPKLLVLTFKTGGGHISLAEALRDELKRDYDIKIIEPYPDYFSAHYRFISRHALWMLSAEYRLTSIPQITALYHQMLSLFAAKSLHAELDMFQPNGLITTSPFLTQEAMQVLKRRSSNIPLIVFISDLSLTSHWLNERNASAIFAPTRESYKQALNTGFDLNHLHLVGWPVRDQFHHTNELMRTEILSKLNLNPSRFTIFLQGGAEGAAKLQQTVENLLLVGRGLQVILAVGTNQALLKRYKTVQNLYALPFTKDIAPFMAASDIIGGKAGANAVMEAMTLGKPFIATTYIRPQEEGILKFIQRHGLGWVTFEPKMQRELITMLIKGDVQLNEFTTKINEYRQLNCAANKSITTLVRSLVPTTST